MPRPFFRFVAQTTAIVAVLGFPLVVSSGPMSASPAQAGAETGLVEVAVMDPTRAMIPGAEIRFQHHPDGAVQTFVADATGKLSVNLQPGKYRLLVSSLGFRRETKEIVVEATSSQKLTVTLDVAAIINQVQLGPAEAARIAAETGTLEFEVKDRDGMWIDGARFEFRAQPDGPAIVPSVADFGRLTVHLSRGWYEVRVAQPGFKDLMRFIEVRGGTTQTFDFVMHVENEECPDGVICDIDIISDPSMAMVLEPETAKMPQLIGGCTEHEKIAEIKPSNPTYGYARELERSLDDLGITVRCVCASKMTGIFRGQAGAAWYRTDDGAFDVLFLPKGRTFAGVRIVRRREADGYLTTFAGKPYSAIRMNSSKPMFFVKRGNMLFSVGSDETLAGVLESRLSK